MKARASALSGRVCVILAAGASKRFGAQKLVHPLSDGRSILQTSIELYQSVFSEILVVVSNSARVQAVVQQQGCESVLNTDSELGLSSSVRAGILHLPKASSFLFALADMPYISSATVTDLYDLMQPDKIVLPRVHGTIGNPVSLGANFRNQLLSLAGDLGAKPVVKANREHHVYLDTDDKGIFHDIDVPADLRP